MRNIAVALQGMDSMCRECTAEEKRHKRMATLEKLCRCDPELLAMIRDSFIFLTRI